MTFREFMAENGYELQTTFWSDFSIADRFGLSAIRDTFNRAFREWKEDYEYLTELVLVLNHKIWQYYETRPDIASLYNTLWEEASQYAVCRTLVRVMSEEHREQSAKVGCSLHPLSLYYMFPVTLFHRARLSRMHSTRAAISSSIVFIHSSPTPASRPYSG